ncbi:hypothetical protein EJ04DRAFT_596178 [Polyplosphaeria fusca]|uniref:Uncharacterized protein n=1 Tax=Polyplosphaeria fusca TaxID=682080 RepID=A0A9P4UVR2_9PLEO|nr:hypothetical protein EJ04DRAFT_596178 [Polyplosphaeria fusca]
MDRHSYANQAYVGYELPPAKEQSTQHVQEYPYRTTNNPRNALLEPNDLNGHKEHTSGNSVGDAGRHIPDWKPYSLRFGPVPSILAIVFIIILYTYCYAQTRSRTYVTISTKSTDIVFRFGPTLLAVVLTEVIQQIVKDMSLIAPFLALPFTATPNMSVVNLFTKHYWLPKKGLALALGCYLLVPLQSGLFEKTMVTLSSTTTNIKQVQVSDFVESLNASTFVSMGAGAVFGSAQRTTPDLADYRWVWRPSKEDGWLGLMPFLPEQTIANDAANTSTEDITWKVNTAAIFSDLTCINVPEFNLSIASLEKSDGTYKMANVSLRFTDIDGCVTNTSWPVISGAESPGMNNPLTPDGTFAFWAPYTFANMTTLFNGALLSDSNLCPNAYWKDIVLVGPLPSSGGHQLTINQNDTGWAAVNCVPATNFTGNTIRYEADGDGVNYKIFEDGDIHGQGTNGPEGGMLINTMKDNLIFTGLIYNLTSPGYGMSFWGQNISHMSTPNTAYNLRDSCESNEFGNVTQDVCQLSRLTKDLWDALFAMTVSMSAQLVPPEKWSTVSVVKQTQSEGWAMSTSSYAFTLVVYLFLLGYLWFNPSLRTRVSGAPRTCSWFRFKRWGPTALHDTPTSIAGLAFLMQRLSVRSVFKEVDGMEEDFGIKTIRKRFKQAALNMSLESSRYVLDVHESRRENYWTHIVPLPSKASHTVWTWLARRPKKTKIDRPENITDLPQNLHPIAVSLKALIPIAVVCATLICIVAIFIVKSTTDYFTMWTKDPTVAPGKLPSEGFRAWIQKQIFEGGPVLVLTAIGLWWGVVDTFFRLSQPFASLSSGDDTKALRLTYMHDFHLQVTGRALKNGHFRLALVTFLTTLSKIAVIFSAGIFSMTTAPSPHVSREPINYIWRSGTFGNGSETVLSTQLLQDGALSSSFSGPLWRSFENEGTYWFPKVELSRETTSTYNATAIKANMTCDSTGAKSVSYEENEWDPIDRYRPSLWNITFTQGPCANKKSIPFTCADKNWWQNETETTDALCVLWGLFTDDNCTDVPGEDIGRWVVGAINTLDGPDRPQNLSVGEPSELSVVMCTPQFFLDELQVTTTRNLDGKSKSTYTLMSSSAIAPDHWISQANSSLGFATAWHEIIESTQIANYDTVNRDLQTGIMGLMTISELGSTERLFDEKQLGIAASNTYSAAFAALLGLNMTDAGDTFLATAATDPETDTVAANQHIYLAKLDRIPLYVGLGLLAAFLLASPLAWAGRKRGTSRSVEYYVNIMAMLYDSEFLDAIAESGETSEFHCLDGRRFAMGVFTGVSGERRVGIDFQENFEG